MASKRVVKIPKKGKLKPNQIYLGDCLEGMKKLDDESIDLVITSPPYADMKVYADGFAGFHPDNYVEWFLPYVAEISRILKPTGSFILNINDKVEDTFRHTFVFELIYAIHNIVDYCKIKGIDELNMNGLKLFERLFWNKGKYLAVPRDLVTRLNMYFGFQRQRIEHSTLMLCGWSMMKKALRE